MKDLKNIKHLNLSHNKAIKDFSVLKDLKNLQYLDLCSTSISDISILKDLKNIQHLNLNFDREIKDFSVLKHLKNLQYLDLRTTFISDISVLKYLKKLQFLDLAGNQQIKDFSILEELTNLQTLYLISTYISDISRLRPLKKLQSLSLNSTHICDIYSLKFLKNLRLLDISSNNISDISSLLPLIRKGLSLSTDFWGSDIRLYDCPITNPPIEVINEGNKAVISYLEQNVKSNEEKIYNVKLSTMGDVPNSIPKNKLKVFISYSKKDRELCKKLNAFLIPLIKGDIIETWENDDILAGQEWKEEIQVKLRTADIMLCLVSSDFFDTDYIMEEELPIMLEREKEGLTRVIPVILRPCPWKDTILGEFKDSVGEYKPLTKYENLDDGCMKIYEGLKKVIEASM